MTYMSYNSNKKGFTLIELLVVIAILGLLATIVMVSLNSARGKARDAKRIADLRQIKNALELYAQDNNGSYPGSCSTYWWISDNNFAGSSGFPPCATSGGLAPYFSSSVCGIKDSQQNPYAYTLKADGTYKLGARLELSANQGTAFTYGCAGQTAVSGQYETK